MSKIVDRYRVAKIKRLIDRQILLRVEQLATFVQLQKSLDRRTFNGQLQEDDLKFIKDQLLTLTKQEKTNG